MENQQQRSPERRRYFRVTYPGSIRPFLRTRTHEFEVLGLAEKSLRFSNPDKVRLVDWVKGTLSFYDGASLEIEGKIVRRHNDEVVLYLITPLPFSRMVQEQRLVIRSG
jgi:hypothetical protein